MKSCAAVGVGFQISTLAWLVAASLAACGGGASPEPKSAEEAAAAASADSANAPPADATAPSGSTTPPSAAAPNNEPKLPAETSVERKPAAAPSKDPNAMREVKYVVTPEGLKIEVAGVRFLAVAEAKQIAQGWGLKINIKAESLDGKEHVLLNPKSGPIAFAAAVFKKGSTEAERIPDSREGEGELKIGPGSPVSFSREFPSKGGRVLAMGETLDMEVALWGLGETADDRRPVKQFCHVKMKVEKGKPKAFVEPPASAAQ